METKLINNKSKNLITFLTGWGCDYNQFEFMTENSNNYDILICYDYTRPDINFDFSKYEKHYLITFSAGVFMAGYIKEALPNFEKTIAINGNPDAYDEYFGLRSEIIDIFNGVTKENAIDFRRKYLVYNDYELKMFNKFTSLRSFESSADELVSLQSYAIKKPTPMKFDTVILSQNDKIFYPDRQKEYWEDLKGNYKYKTKCIYLENSAHFPFFRLNNFEEIIDL